jgi:hypothetical protein
MTDQQNIFNNTLCLDVFCLDLLEQAADYCKGIVRQGTIREAVENWVEDRLTPALECALDDLFEEDRA